MKRYIIENGKKIDLIVNSTPLAKGGGQGTVYKINTAGYNHYCFKEYHTHIKWDIDRINYMIENPPQTLESDEFKYKICWPKYLVYDSITNVPVGFLMPLAYPNSKTLKILDSTHCHKTIQEEFPNDVEWWKYERSKRQGIINRLKILNNISIAVHCIHEVGCYVIGDFKPENIMATHDGQISIIDTDSFQISKNQQILFPCSAKTIAYLAPESYSRIERSLPLKIANDLFAIAVFFYQVLIGCGPYAGRRQLAPYDKDGSLKYLIKNGLFAFGERSNYLAPTKGEDRHEYFQKLPNEIQLLFKSAFSISNTFQRPQTQEWIQILNSHISNPRNIKGNKNTTKSKLYTHIIISKKWYKKWQYLSLAAVVVLCVFIGAIFIFTKPLVPEILIPPFDSLMLIGDYTAKYIIDGQSSGDIMNGYIEAISQNEYRITIYSDFDPVSFSFIYDGKTKSSTDIQITKLFHDENYHQIQIIFKKDNQLWELTKELAM